jgi:predicted nucleic acid-binding protein
MFSFDTNILAYATDAEAGLRHVAAVRLVADAEGTEAKLNGQSLIEFVRYMKQKRACPVAEARLAIARWRDAFDVMPYPDDAPERTLALLERHSLSVWDAHMLAVCGSNGCDALLSEDMTDGMIYEGVRVVNPFIAGNARAIAELLGG